MKKLLNIAVAAQMVMMSPAVFAQNYNNAPATRPYVYGPNNGGGNYNNAPVALPPQQQQQIQYQQGYPQQGYGGQQPINLDQQRMYQNGGGYYGGGYRPQPKCNQIPYGYPGSCVQPPQQKNNLGLVVGVGAAALIAGVLLGRGGLGAPVGGPVVAGPPVGPGPGGPVVGPAPVAPMPGPQVPPPAGNNGFAPPVGVAPVGVAPVAINPNANYAQNYMNGFNSCMGNMQCGPRYVQPIQYQGNPAQFYFQPQLQGPIAYNGNINGLPNWIQPGTQCRTYQNFVVNAGNINMQYNQVSGMACNNNGQWIPVANPNGQLYITNGTQWGPGINNGAPVMVQPQPGYNVQPQYAPRPLPPPPPRYVQPVQMQQQMRPPVPNNAPAVLPPQRQNVGVVNNGGQQPIQPIARPCNSANPQACPATLPPQPQAMR
jgi:hypothetical protein